LIGRVFAEKIAECWDPLYDGRVSNDEFSDVASNDDDDDDDGDANAGKDDDSDDDYCNVPTDLDDSEWNDTGYTRKRVWVIEQDVKKKFVKEKDDVYSNWKALTIT